MVAWRVGAVASAITYLVSLTLLVTFLHRDGLVSLSAADVRRVVLPFVVLGVLGAVALGFPVRLRSGAALQNIAAATGVMVAFVAAGWAVNASTVKGMVRSMRAG